MVERLAWKTGIDIAGAGGHGYEAAAPVGAIGISVTLCSVTAHKLQEHLGRCDKRHPQHIGIAFEAADCGCVLWGSGISNIQIQKMGAYAGILTASDL